MKIATLLFFIFFSAQGFCKKGNVVEKLAHDYHSTKQELVRDEIKQRKIMSSLFDINKKMKKIITERADLVQESMVTESTTRDLAEKIIVLESKLKEQKSLMRERLSAIYKFGGQGVARFLFSSSNSAQLERNLKVLGIIAKRDLDIIKSYSRNMRELESKKVKFTQRLARFKKLEKRIQEQEKRLVVENENKSKLLKQIRESKEFRLSKLNGLRAKTNQLVANDDSGVLDALFKPSLFEFKGHLPSPVRGTITKNFGIIRDPDFNVSWAHKGIFISTTEGSKIHAIFDGKVSYVGEVPGFGQTIILDHGDHYYSVYSYNRKPLVSVGDEIKQNHVIAESGLSFDDEEPGLYFEIRHFSEPYDPKLWLKGLQL